jgi:hypothetical protein
MERACRQEKKKWATFHGLIDAEGMQLLAEAGRRSSYCSFNIEKCVEEASL